ncbi:MAG: TAXI family TRAP transporter solute-binding subunit [bacterium]|nr:TAXI family TRAP transporter solute-binding subunit [bacterium]
MKIHRQKFMIVLAVFAMTLMLSAPAGAAKRLLMGSWKQGSGWHVYSATMANIVNNANLGFQVDALAKGGGVGNPVNVGTGKYDLALTFSLAANWGYQGKVAYKKAYNNLRGLIGGLDQYYLGIVTTNPKVMSISDLKKVPVNYVTVPRGGLGQWATQAMLGAHGITYDSIKKMGGSATHTGFDVIKSRMKDGQADMLSHTVNAGHPSLTAIAIQKKLRFLEVEDEFRDKLLSIGFLKATLPANTFPGQATPRKTFGFTTSLIASTKMDNGTAYKIVKTLLDNVKDLRAGHKGLRSFDPAKTAWQEAQNGAPLHPGAARYYKEKGWMN